MSSESSQFKIQRLYEIYEQPMYRIAYAILHNASQSEDAVHDAFVAIMKSKAEIGDPESAETKHFMIRTIRNTAINRYRKNVRDSEYFTEIDDTAMQIADDKNEVEDCIKHMELTETVDEIFSDLSTSEREILLLRCQEELSFGEIAKRLSLSESTVRKRYERARKAARKQKGACIYG